MNDTACEVSVTDDVVLVCLADDDLRQRVTETLRSKWPVRTAHDDRAAGESLDEAVSVVVFDLGDGSIEIDSVFGRRGENGIAFETAALVDDAPPEDDGRPDGYVRKPVSDDDLRATVERLHRRVRYDRLLGRYYAVASDYAEAASRAQHDPERLIGLKERLFALRRRLDEVAGGLGDHDAFDAALGESEGDESDDFSQR